MQATNLYTTIASRNPQQAYDLVRSEGYNIPKSKEQVAMSLADMVRKQGEPALVKIAEVHPDKELFKKEQIMEVKNCDGCDKYKSVDATETTGKKFILSENAINIIIVASAVVFTFTALGIMISRIK
jgi:hypothetical protein